MGRMLLTVVIGAALFVGVAWYTGLLGGDHVETPKDQHTKAAATHKLGDLLYRPLPLAPEPVQRLSLSSPIVIPGHVVVTNKLDVTSPIEGQLLFIGEEVPDEVVCLAGVAPFTASPFLFTTVTQGTTDLTVIYREIKRGEMVNSEQMVALLDPAKALNEVAKHAAKYKAAEAEAEGSILTYKEAQARFETAEKLWRRTPPLIAEEDYRERKLAAEKYKKEIKSKEEAMNLAKAEENSARIILKQHTIRNKIPFRRSVVKTIYRNSGEAIKASDPIMHLYSTDTVLADGMVDVQFQARLTLGMPVIVEPTIEEPPTQALKEHRGEITSVAVTKNGLIVSGSEDKTVRVWTSPATVLTHPEPVRVIACSPRESKRNLCVVGCANGSIYIWDLDSSSKEPLKVLKEHTDAVSSLAFSPEVRDEKGAVVRPAGAWFASGGADNLICLWNTEKAELIYPFDPDHGVDHPPTGTVTSLAFTPQAKLVSASRDNMLRVWALHEKGAHLEDDLSAANRSGNVTQLGVSRDGRWMLFDQGRTLQLLSVVDGRTLCVLQNPSGTVPFETLAQFSPDGSLILTAGAAEGRMQLWHTPSPGKRGFEVRQMVTEEKSPVTCAVVVNDPALALNGSGMVAVSGAKDGTVYVWPIPTREQVDNHRIRNVRLSMLAQTVDTGSRQLQVGVELQNHDGRLLDGRPITIVIEPGIAPQAAQR